MARQPKTARPKSKFGMACACGSKVDVTLRRVAGVLRWVCPRCFPL